MVAHERSPMDRDSRPLKIGQYASVPQIQQSEVIDIVEMFSGTINDDGMFSIGRNIQGRNEAGLLRNGSGNLAACGFNDPYGFVDPTSEEGLAVG
ncbi:MAG: hypothetical protein DMG45_18875 [Acidobacteria bacterium]|nr:MAG: hypothetical protein DMG45_18875 [Acidobacteriota bacterium]